MKHAIRKHLRDFMAIIVLFVIALAWRLYILANQRLYLPGWVPFVGTELLHRQRRVQHGAGGRAGPGPDGEHRRAFRSARSARCRSKNGVAVVQMKIKKKHSPIYKNATLLLRPKTGLKDMYIEMNPGTKTAGSVAEGGTSRCPTRCPT